MEVYKIEVSSIWEEAVRAGIYTGSPDDVRDGFIHLSTAEQAVGTAHKHFAGRDGLIVLAFDATTLGSALRWEPSRGGALFPHLHGTLDPSLALWSKPMPLGTDGIPQVPDLEN
ncbi:MAG: DUF952 domain-containing protein [Pseudomonadota bacterium]